jgi:hypothetical protein
MKSLHDEYINRLVDKNIDPKDINDETNHVMVEIMNEFLHK